MTFRVALTFDAEHPDRPHRIGGTERVLEILDAERIPATFFIQGRWAEAYPPLARSIAERGHLIGNHSFYHARMPLLSPSGLSSDVRAAERAIIAVTGVDPRPWFRCPFGAGMDDPRVLAAIEELGYQHVGWEHDPRDWDEGRTVDELMAGVGPGIVLLHAWPTVTAEGLGLVIAGLRDQGAEFVGVDELG